MAVSHETLHRISPYLSAVIDLNHKSGFNPGRQKSPAAASPAAIGDAITAAIDKWLIATRDLPRGYLGASILGDPCARKIFYQATNTPADRGSEITGRTLRIFALGHVFEATAGNFLLRAGFDLRITRKDGEQFGFSAAGGRIAGHIDGALIAGPVELPYPLGWECKSLNAKSWNDTAKRGVKLSKETYYGQMQLYMAYMDGLDAFLFTAINKDTAEFYHEIVLFDAPVAQRLSDRAAEILMAIERLEPPSRIASKPDFYLCKMCRYAARCWEEG